jgi:hypothetical protein
MWFIVYVFLKFVYSRLPNNARRQVRLSDVGESVRDLIGETMGSRSMLLFIPSPRKIVVIDNRAYQVGRRLSIVCFPRSKPLHDMKWAL